MEEPQVQPTNGSAQPVGAQQEGGDGLMIFLAYFGIFSLIPYLTVKDNDFVRWHAKQGLTLFGVWVVGSIVLTVVSAILGFIPVLGWMLDLLLWAAFGIGGFVAWLMGMIKAFGGERWRIPVIADLADRW